MAQSFDAVVLDNSGSIVNFGGAPPSVLDTPVTVVNANSRTSPIVIIDGSNSVAFTGTYTILTGGLTEYNLIKAKQGTIGTLVNGSQTVLNVVLRAVGLAQTSGGVITCSLSFEYLG